MRSCNLETGEVHLSVLAQVSGYLFLAGAAMAQGGITTGGNTQRPIFVSGMVVMEDGHPPPEKVDIQLVCQGQSQPQGKTDSAGKFTVQLGQDRHLGSGDASVGSSASGSGFGGALSGQTQVDGASVMSLMGCGLRAVFKNARSEMFDLSRVRAGEPTNVGTLILRNGGAGKGDTVSATTLKAPKDAQKAFEKAQEAIAKKQPADAEKALRKAVEVFPQYADAWQELGGLLQSTNRAGEARQSYQHAIDSDPRYARAYLSLARLSALEKNWQDAIEMSQALIRLDANSYPQAHYYQAVAQYNLKDKEKAFESAKRAVQLDVKHTVPLAEQLLGVLYSERGDYSSAAVQLRNYLQHVPPGTNTEAVKTLLADTEKRIK